MIADLDAATGSQTAKDIGASFYTVNVADEVSVQAMANYLDQMYSKIDVLIQTAGILSGAYTPLEQFTAETFRAVLDVNITGTFLCVKHLVPLLRLSKRGVILLIASDTTSSSYSSFAFGTSKGGVTSLAATLAKRLENDNIRVNVISPGNIDTGMKRAVIAVEAERTGINFEEAIRNSKLGSAEGIAKILCWLASDEADYVRGVITTR